MLSACKATCSSGSPPWSPRLLLLLLLRCLLGLCLLSPPLLALRVVLVRLSRLFLLARLSW